MMFAERMIELLDQGITASKEFALKAGGKAQDFGERGIRQIEIRQLEKKVQKLINKLGIEAYRAFVINNLKKIDSNMPVFGELLAEIEELKKIIGEKEGLL